MSLVAFDARDAWAEPLRGWGRYARDLLAHLPADRVRPLTGGSERVPEVVWEQAGLARAARAAGASVLHAPNCFLPLRRGGLPGVVTVHDLAFEAYPEDFSRRTGTKYRVLTPRAARSAERVVCVSAFTAGDVVRRYGVDERRVRVIPNAPSLPVGAGPVAGGPPYGLAVGDLRGKKNLARLVEAWERLGSAAPDRLVLAGHGEWPGPLPAGVEVTGYVDDAALDALVRGASVLVHPSLYEGFGLVVVEAMARGIPVACSATTALGETAGDAAALFDPLDVADIARGIADALARSSELAFLGRARAATLSWERSAAATLAVYEELL